MFYKWLDKYLYSDGLTWFDVAVILVAFGLLAFLYFGVGMR